MKQSQIWNATARQADGRYTGATVNTTEYAEFLDAAKQNVAVSVLQKCFDLDDAIGMYIQRSDFEYLGMPEVPDADTPTVTGEIRSEEALTDALFADLRAWATDGAPIPIALALDELTHAEHNARRHALRPPPVIPVGTRVRLTESVERYPKGTVDAGAMGTVTTITGTEGERTVVWTGRGVEGVTLDNPPDWIRDDPNCDGELQWGDDIESGGAPMSSQVERIGRGLL